MELRDIYKISDIVKREISDGNLTPDVARDMEITLRFDGPTYFGIDKEFYYMTHGNSYEGFVHSEDMVTATIDGIKFVLKPKNTGTQ